VTGPFPRSLTRNPRLDQWIFFGDDRSVTVMTGKVEIGQGILTALVQMAADELQVSPSRIRIKSGDTGDTPDEMFTAGSQSVEVSGHALRIACADVRESCLQQAATLSECPPALIRITDGSFAGPGVPAGLDYWTCGKAIDWRRHVRADATLRQPGSFHSIGTSLPRLDLPAKLTGAAFIHDLTFDSMVHARVIRKPRPVSRLDTGCLEGLRRQLPLSIELLVMGDFVALCADTEKAVVAAAEKASTAIRWRDPLSRAEQDFDTERLKELDTIDRSTEAAGRAHQRNAVSDVAATYRRPYLAHGSIAPSCAIAHWDGATLSVWSHTQGVFPLRGALAQFLQIELRAIVVHHCQGAGCYGHNGADDVAGDAALIAKCRPGRHIRVQWSRQDELSASPYGAASVVEIRAGVDADGKPTSWDIEIWSPTHNQRPGSRGAPGLLAGEALPEPMSAMPPGDVPDELGGGGSRNSFAIYDLPPQRLTHHLVTGVPLRTSALRGLGAQANVFAIETFIDELAERAGTDPIAYRLHLLSDCRARNVIETVMQMSSWAQRPRGGDGVGYGVAFSRYKNRAAYVAIVATVEVDEDVRVKSIWCAADAGLVVNPDGAINQIEGGIIQALSWTLKEEVRLNSEGQLPATWDDYPILRFSEVPEVNVHLVSTNDVVTLGVGEVAVGPATAALGNAISNALGQRFRELPLSRERIAAALLTNAS
jgi:nicotinate dehydrogenase subunit B